MDTAFFAGIQRTAYADARYDIIDIDMQLISQSFGDVPLFFVHANLNIGNGITHAQAAARWPWLVWVITLC